jgi:tRNA G18 (ribose-2'-O)-methylase SpoU
MRKIKNEELDRLTVSDFKMAEKFPLVIVLDNVRSLNNIGSAFRTADCFRLQAIHLCGITAQPPHREIQKTALGATETVDWKYFENTQDSLMALKKSGYQIYSIEQIESSISLDDFIPDRRKKYALVFGNEINGVSEKAISVSDGFIEIPQFGTKHSFNVSVSIGIVLWQFFLHLK